MIINVEDKQNDIMIMFRYICLIENNSIFIIRKQQHYLAFCKLAFISELLFILKEKINPKRKCSYLDSLHLFALM